MPVTCLPPSMGPTLRWSPWGMHFSTFLPLTLLGTIMAPPWQYLGSNIAHYSPKMYQDSPKMLQDARKMPSNAFKMSQDAPKTLSRPCCSCFFVSFYFSFYLSLFFFRHPSLFSLFSLLSLLLSSLPLLPNCGGELPYWVPLGTVLGATWGGLGGVLGASWAHLGATAGAPWG